MWQNILIKFSKKMLIKNVANNVNEICKKRFNK